MVQENYSIQCLNFIKVERKIKFTLIKSNEDSLKEYEIYFEFDRSIYYTNDDIAIVLCRMFKFYKSIYIDLVISKSCADFIEKHFKYPCQFQSVSDQNNLCVRDTSDHLILCFTGGFDSLSLATVLSSDFVHLTFVDFIGLWSKREREWCNRFHTNIVKTNLLLELGYQHVTFQQVPCIFFRHFYHASYITLGDILEYENAYNIDKNYTCDFCMPNIQYNYFSHGLSEICSALILAYYKPEILEYSFKSCADHWTEKWIRKYLILKALEKFSDYKVNFVIEQNLFGKAIFHRTFVEGFQTLFFLKFFGIEFAHLYCKNIPDDALNIVKSIKGNFFLKLNPSCLINNSKYLNSIFLKNLARCGILPYNLEDFQELMLVKNYLMKNIQY